tara:strand:+ start:1830 stop:2201 length:372 start_codon:yes stop_codon:yes gene_type:complete
MNRKHQIIQKSCDLARDYYGENKSPRELIGASGYINLADEITVEEIEEYISEHPESRKKWISYSMDKRTSTGWYLFFENLSGPFRVGYMHPDEKKRFEQNHDDLNWACSLYIKHELDSIASGN